MQVCTVKYRLYPTAAQESFLRRALAVCRQVYNSLLHWRKHDFEVYATSPNYLAQQNALPLWKKAHPELCEVYLKLIQVA